MKHCVLHQPLRGFLLILCSFGVVNLAGCFDAGPKIVRAQQGVDAPLQFDRQAMQDQQALQSTIAVNRSVEGTSTLCGNYEIGPIWLIYGVNGQVTEQRNGGASRTGMRFELGNPLLGNHRTSFQFDRREEPRLYKRTQSDGSSVELFSDAKTDAPVMQCFSTLPKEFVWIDFTLLEFGPQFVGTWNCEGPLGTMSMNASGAMTTVQGPAQAFIWSQKQIPHLSVFMSEKVQPDAQKSQEAGAPSLASFGRFFEGPLELGAMAQGRWGYDVSNGAGKTTRNTCTKQSIPTSVPKNP